MKEYIFPLFITILGLFVAYAFYAVWHSEELNPQVIFSTKNTQKNENSSNKKIIPKDTLTVPVKINLLHPSIESDEYKINEEIEKETNIPNLTPEQTETRTQVIYESLTPDSYEETMEEATIAFEKIDEEVEILDNKLAEEMNSMEENELITEPTEERVEEKLEDEEPVTIEEEEIDMEHEDVNNP